jgi:hypothetical protein
MPTLREVAQLDPDPVERARATWIEEILHARPLGDGPRAASLIAAAEQAGQAGDRDLQLDMAWLIASRAWMVDPAPMARKVLIEAADRLGDPESADLRILAIQAYADPFGKAPAILQRLRQAAADVHRDTDAARYLGPAAVAVGAAQGLSNRDIAQRLYLSHPTIGTHLYRIFPKLGITSRGELRSALSSSTALGKR